MAEIAQRTSNTCVAPPAVVACHTQHEFHEVLSSSRSVTAAAATELLAKHSVLGDQDSVTER